MSAFKAGFLGCLGVGAALLAVLAIAGALGSSVATPRPSSSELPFTVPINASAAAATLAPPTPQPTPVVLRGTGQMATDQIRLPAAISVAAFTHAGRSNFIVEVFRGSQKSLLINTIGAYQGSRPLTGTDPVRLNIEADGAWTVTISAIQCCATSGAFIGKGDAVSNQFTAAGTSTWAFSHDGRSNFIVELHCAVGRDQLVQNRIGAFQGSSILTIPSGPCYWEVEADGNWSLTPR